MRESIFGIPVRYGTWNGQNALPLYIAGSYEFRTAHMADKRCIIIRPVEELAALPALKKQIQIIQEVDSVPVILELKAVSFYRKKSLIENLIPFISEKQAFLPFIGAVLTDEKEPEKKKEKFVFSTQQLFLFYLYGRKKRMYVSEAAKKLPFTAMTLTRAVRQLEATGFFLVTKDGINKVIESKFDGKELFQKAKQYLSTPVRKVGYIEKAQVTSHMVFAGETALAEKTMLNQNKVITYAVSDKNYDKKMLSDELIDAERQVRLELWAYDPKMFSTGNTADNLSVALSFQDNSDERIEEAVEELIEGELEDNG